VNKKTCIHSIHNIHNTISPCDHIKKFKKINFDKSCNLLDIIFLQVNFTKPWSDLVVDFVAVVRKEQLLSRT